MGTSNYNNSSLSFTTTSPMYDNNTFITTNSTGWISSTPPSSGHYHHSITLYLDDQFEFELELAGFKKEEITVKYLPENENSASYIEITASSENHFRKNSWSNDYSYYTKTFLAKDRDYDFDKLSVSFENGVLKVVVPFAENSKVKTATIS